jgi:hypothetical protein
MGYAVHAEGEVAVIDGEEHTAIHIGSSHLHNKKRVRKAVVAEELEDPDDQDDADDLDLPEDIGEGKEHIDHAEHTDLCDGDNVGNQVGDNEAEVGDKAEGNDEVEGHEAEGVDEVEDSSDIDAAAAQGFQDDGKYKTETDDKDPEVNSDYNARGEGWGFDDATEHLGTEGQNPKRCATTLEKFKSRGVRFLFTSNYCITAINFYLDA